MRNFKIGMLGLLVTVTLLVLWLAIAPPSIIRVGANYSAKIVCSNVFVANRDAQEVLAVDVQAPGHPLLTVMRVTIDEESSRVYAALFGLFGEGLAVHRPGYGCSSLPDDRYIAVDDAKITESGSAVRELPPVQNSAVSAVLNDPDLVGPNMRAVVVLKNGQIIAEKYNEGFSQSTPLLGWSMTKTVTAALVGTLIKNGTLALNDRNLFPSWQSDDRKNIQLQDLLGMASGLEWNEDYGSVTDVTRMLFLQGDMAALPMEKPLVSEIGKTFKYSSGTSVLVSKYIQNKIGNGSQQIARANLFDPLGMTSARYELDAVGTLVGGSYMYATSRDWARFGQFLLQRGKWDSQALLPENYVEWMIEPHSASEGEYGKGHVWRRAPGEKEKSSRLPFPADAYWLAGHDGQSIAIVPSENMVILRMGLTPAELEFKASKLASAIIEAAR